MNEKRVSDSQLSLFSKFPTMKYAPREGERFWKTFRHPYNGKTCDVYFDGNTIKTVTEESGVERRKILVSDSLGIRYLYNERNDEQTQCSFECPACIAERAVFAYKNGELK